MKQLSLLWSIALGMRARFAPPLLGYRWQRILLSGGRRTFWLALMFGSLVGCGVDTASPEVSRPVVNFYNWFNFIGPQTLSEFTQDTGIAVNYDIYDSDNLVDGKLLVGNSGYDLVVPTSTNFARQHAAGLYLPLDWSRLSNARELDPYLLDKLGEVDPGNRFGVPHSWGTTGIAYDADRLLERMPDAPLDSWRLIFDPRVAERFADCGIALLDAPMDVVPAALLYLGRDPASQSTKDLRDAINVVAGIRPYIRYFNSSQFVDDLANGEICLALGWSGEAIRALRASDNLDLRYVIPKEGGLLWFEVLAIPADAPNIDNAYRLIDHLLNPRVAADFTNATYYPSGVASAWERIDPAIRSEPAVYPPPSVRKRLFTTPPESAEFVRERLRLWTSVKAG